MADLPLPAAQVVREFVHEHDREAFPGFFIVELHAPGIGEWHFFSQK
jgi:hypothetical protein